MMGHKEKIDWDLIDETNDQKKYRRRDKTIMSKRERGRTRKHIEAERLC